MKLIVILMACAMDYSVHVLGKVRDFSWFFCYCHLIERRCAHWSVWNGPVSVLFVLVPPLTIFSAVCYLLCLWHVAVYFLFSLLVLLYCLGPGNLFYQVQDYLDAENDEDASDESVSAKASLISDGTDHNIRDSGFYLIESILLQSNRRIFAVLFWFIVLGPVGALLYRLVSELQKQGGKTDNGYSVSVNDLYAILNWPSSRLLVAGFALAGSLVHVFEEWRLVDNGSVFQNDAVIKAAGLAAVQFEDDFRDLSAWVHEVNGLVKRTLALWLAIVGLVALRGWLG